MIWERHLTLDKFNATSQDTSAAYLGMVYIRLRDDVPGTGMPVDDRTHQPSGLLHGGVPVTLIETLGSMAGYLMTRDGQCAVGTGPSATYHRTVSQGKVRGTC